MRLSEKAPWLTWKNAHRVAIILIMAGTALVMAGLTLGTLAGNPLLAFGGGASGLWPLDLPTPPTPPSPPASPW